MTSQQGLLLRALIHSDGCRFINTGTAPHTVYVSRKADVDLLDRYIGPKR